MYIPPGGGSGHVSVISDLVLSPFMGKGRGGHTDVHMGREVGKRCGIWCSNDIDSDGIGHPPMPPE